MATVEQMRKFALSLPDVTEKPHFKDIGFHVKKRLFASVNEEKKEGVVGTTPDELEALMEAEPEIFSKYGRATGSVAGLVIKLPKISIKEMQRLVSQSHQMVAAASKKKKK